MNKYGGFLAIASAVTVLFLQLSQIQCQYQIVVSTDHGDVEGFTINSMYEAYPKRRVNVFLGIPYAKRPNQFQDWRREFRFNVSLNETKIFSLVCLAA